jgi:CheY-like chemotaxis protein
MANETILIIEDNDIQREGLAHLLRDRGYNVITAKDSFEGLRWMRTGPRPNLILLDMLIRQTSYGGDGWAFMSRRQHDPELSAVPVIITTGISSACDEWAASLGANGLLRKPIDGDEIFNAVTKCL